MFKEARRDSSRFLEFGDPTDAKNLRMLEPMLVLPGHMALLAHRWVKANATMKKMKGPILRGPR